MARSLTRLAAGVAALTAVALTMMGAPSAAASTCPTVSVDGTVTPAPNGAATHWSGCDLTNGGTVAANLDGAFLANADLSGANLTKASLWTSNLYFTNLSGANLTGAYLNQVWLSSTDLTNATLTGADLSLAKFYPYNSAGQLLPGAALAGADMSHANLTYAGLSHEDLSSTTLTGASMSGADLSYANASGALLTGVDLTNADMSFADFSYQDFTTISFWGPNYTQAPNLLHANLAGANLSSKSLVDSDMRWSNLSGAALAAADLSGADLYGSNASGASMASALLNGADLRASNLAGADLTKADLTGALLYGSTLSGTNLTAALMTRVTSGGVVGSPAALPPGWMVANGNLVGPGAWLQNMDLSGAQLAGVDLTEANLTGVTFAGADLTGAVLIRSVVTGVIWGDAICPDGIVATSHDAGSCARPLDTTSPTASMSPPRVFQTTTSFAVSWRGSDSGSGVDTYDVRLARQPVGGGALSTWTLWKSAVPATTATLTATPGYRYCFQVRATDRGHNIGGWSQASCTVAPVDDRGLAVSSGWLNGGSTGWYASTYRTSSTAGASLTSGTVASYQVGVIATTCATCGSVDVYLGATKVGTISLVSKSTQTRASLLLRRFSHRLSGRVRLVVHARGHLVRIDALLTTST